MTRTFNWKPFGIALAALSLASVCCFVAGNTGAASALAVVAIAEGLFSAAFVAIKHA